MVEWYILHFGSNTYIAKGLAQQDTDNVRTGLTERNSASAAALRYALAPPHILQCRKMNDCDLCADETSPPMPPIINYYNI